jgi:hypothetical protein
LEPLSDDVELADQDHRHAVFGEIMLDCESPLTGGMHSRCFGGEGVATPSSRGCQSATDDPQTGRSSASQQSAEPYDFFGRLSRRGPTRAEHNLASFCHATKASPAEFGLAPEDLTSTAASLRSYSASESPPRARMTSNACSPSQADRLECSPPPRLAEGKLSRSNSAKFFLVPLRQDRL